MKYLIATLCLLLCLSADPVQMLQAPLAGLDNIRLRTQNESVAYPNHANN